MFGCTKYNIAHCRSPFGCQIKVIAKLSTSSAHKKYKCYRNVKLLINGSYWWNISCSITKYFVMVSYILWWFPAFFDGFLYFVMVSYFFYGFLYLVMVSCIMLMVSCIFFMVSCIFWWFPVFLMVSCILWWFSYVVMVTLCCDGFLYFVMVSVFCDGFLHLWWFPACFLELLCDSTLEIQYDMQDS